MRARIATIASLLVFGAAAAICLDTGPPVATKVSMESECTVQNFEGLLNVVGADLLGAIDIARNGRDSTLRFMEAAISAPRVAGVVDVIYMKGDLIVKRARHSYFDRRWAPTFNDGVNLREMHAARRHFVLRA